MVSAAVGFGSTAFGEYGSGAYDAGTPVPPIHPPKMAVCHIYNEAGEYITTWADVASLPVFTRQINSGPSALTIELPRTWGAVGLEGEPATKIDVHNGNLVDIYIVDRESGYNGIKIYSGIIKEHRTLYPDGNVSVVLFPRSHAFKSRWIDENEVLTFTDTDPTNMAKYLVDNGFIPGVTWRPENPIVGQKFTQTFSKMNVGQVLEIVQQLAGGKWYYELRPDNTFVFDKWSTDLPATHVIKPFNASEIQFIYSEIDTYRRVFVYGAPITDDEGIVIGRIVGSAAKGGYDPTISPSDLVVTDERITDTDTAIRRAFSLLEAHGEEEIDTEISIPDNTIDFPEGYDIESLNCGDTVSILSAEGTYQFYKWDAFDWDEVAFWDAVEAGLIQLPLVISEIEYGYTGARVKLTSRPVSVVDELVRVQEKQLVEGAT